MNRTMLVTSVTLSLVAGPACAKQETADGFDPSGSDGSIAARWTINELPATSALCAAAGIEKVEIVVYAEADLGYEDGHVVAAVPCAEGRFESGAILAAGRYLTSVDALDADGTMLGSHESGSVVEIAPGARLDLDTADFTTITSLVVTLEWATDTASTIAGACDEAAVATYGYALRDGSGAEIEAFTDLACEDVLFFEDIPSGSYTLEVEAADAGGLPRWRATCADLALGEGEYVEATCRVSMTPE